MYITTDLFAASGQTDSQKHSPSTSKWNAGTGQPHPTSLGKRRRGADIQESTSLGYPSIPTTLSSPNKASNKHHCVNLRPFEREDYEYNAAQSTTSPLGGMRPIKQARRMNQAMVTKLVTPLFQLSQGQHHSAPTSSRSHLSSTHTIASTCDVRPCHICYKSPMRRRDLESFMTCSSCAKRACYICTRICAGGCLRHICSTCCKEIGEDGVTCCFTCLEGGMENS